MKIFLDAAIAAVYQVAVNGRTASASPLNPQSLCHAAKRAQWANRCVRWFARDDGAVGRCPG